MKRKCIINYFEQGYSMRQIGKMCECSHSTVLRFLKNNYDKNKYQAIIKNKPKKKYTTRKYKMWDASCVRYFKKRYDKKPFGYFYKNKYVPIGTFDDFLTVEIINKLLMEYK